LNIFIFNIIDALSGAREGCSHQSAPDDDAVFGQNNVLLLPSITLACRCNCKNIRGSVLNVLECENPNFKSLL
jgi:hypothetical protein